MNEGIFKLALCILLMLSLFTTCAYAADGDAAEGKLIAETCIACHGVQGANPPAKEWPKLAGQHESYLIEQLLDYKQGKKSGRPDPIMQGIVANLSVQDILDLSAYYANQQVNIGQAQAGKLLAMGQSIYRGGIEEKGIPACIACHGPSGAGNGPALFPSLRGQNADYIVLQLKAYKSGARKNDRNDMMKDISLKLNDEEMKAVANYIQGLY